MIYSVEKQDDNYFVSVSDNQGKIIYPLMPGAWKICRRGHHQRIHT